MKTLRKLHLALGCLFAPMLIVFTISGIWQSVPSSFTRGLPSWLVNTMALFGTLHTGRALKLGQTLSSGIMIALTIAMAMSFLLTISLGVVMAFRFGHRKVALGCLVLGVVVPAAVCFMAYHSGSDHRARMPGKEPRLESQSELRASGSDGLTE